MKESTLMILQTTPYNSYDDLFSAIRSNRASIRLSNRACRELSSFDHHVFANLGILLGFIPSAILTVACSIHSRNYFLLFLLLFQLIIPYIIYALHSFRIRTWPVVLIAVFVDLFLFELPLFVLIILLSWLFTSWLVRWWQKRIYVLSLKVLEHDELAFVWAYTTNNLIIEDCYGNRYSNS